MLVLYASMIIKGERRKKKVCAGWWKKGSVGGGEKGSLSSGGKGVVDPGGRGTSVVPKLRGLVLSQTGN